VTPPSLLAPCCCVLLLSPCFLPHVTLSSPHCCHVSHHCCCDSTVTLLLLISSLPRCPVSPLASCYHSVLFHHSHAAVLCCHCIPLVSLSSLLSPVLSLHCLMLPLSLSPCCPVSPLPPRFHPVVPRHYCSYPTCPILPLPLSPSSSLPPSLSSHGPPVVCDDDITIISLQSVRCHPVVLCCHHNCPLVVLCVTVITPCPLFPHFILPLPRPVSALPSGSVLSLVELST